MSNTKITSAVIKDANILTAAIADAAVTSAKIADDVALAGNPTAGTQTAGNNSTRLATTAYTDAAVTALVDSSPSTLNTLNELAAALGDDPNFATTTATSIGLKAPLASPVFTGNVSIGGSGYSRRLTLNKDDQCDLAIRSANDQSAQLLFGDQAADNQGGIQYNNTTDSLHLKANGGNKLDLLANGYVGIGGVPLKPLHLKASSGWATMRLEGASDSGGELEFYKGSTKAGGIFFDNSNKLQIRTGNTPRMSIDASGQLLLGTTTSDSTLSVDIQNTSASSNNTLVRIKNTAGSEDSGLIIDGNNGGQQEYRIGVNTAADTSDLTFSGGTGYRWYTGSTQRMSINASGNVGIGVVPEAWQAGWTAQQIGARSNTVYTSGGAFRTNNAYRDSVNSRWEYQATDQACMYELSDSGTHAFYVAPSGTADAAISWNTAMTINNGGDVLVGTTDDAAGAGNTATGISLRGGTDNRSFFSVNQNYVMHLNRKGNSGNILEFAQDGSGVGSIGSLNGDLYLDSTGGELSIRINGTTLYEFDSNLFYPKVDNSKDLGHSGGRWKDLYLSGGVYLGGTGAANKLDDYEEGTWTPAASSDASATAYNYATGYYTKIGRKVHVTGQFRISTIGSFSGAVINITGLPFNITNLTNYDPRGIVGIKNAATAKGAIFLRGVSNTNYMRLEANNGNTSSDRNCNANVFDTDTICYVDLTYFVA